MQANLPPLTFATGNNDKFFIARGRCALKGIELEQLVLEVDEIQGEDSEKIAVDKAKRAYEVAQRPVVVSDYSWSFNGLNGFPGAYMKSMIHWLSPDKFLDLMQHVDDRSALLTQFLIYQDENETTVFRNEIQVEILREARGKHGPSIDKIAVMEFDDGKTIAEVYDLGLADSPERLAKYPSAWEDVMDLHRARHQP